MKIYVAKLDDDDSIEIPPNAIKDIDPNDIVYVVRCKDCIHNSLNRKCGNACCNLGLALYQLDDYCSRGERRDEE